MNVICFISHKKQRLLKTTIEELNITVRVYNFLKRLRITSLQEVFDKKGLIKERASNNKRLLLEIENLFNTYHMLLSA